MTELKISDFATEISAWRKRQGFITPDLMLGKLMLVVTEVSEAAEAVRHDDVGNFKEELADAFIRLMDITSSCGYDIESEIRSKMAVNEQRPYKHAKKCSL